MAAHIKLAGITAKRDTALKEQETAASQEWNDLKTELAQKATEWVG